MIEFSFLTDAHHNPALPFPPILPLVTITQNIIIKSLLPGKGLYLLCEMV